MAENPLNDIELYDLPDTNGVFVDCTVTHVWSNGVDYYQDCPAVQSQYARSGTRVTVLTTAKESLNPFLVCKIDFSNPSGKSSSNLISQYTGQGCVGRVTFAKT